MTKTSKKNLVLAGSLLALLLGSACTMQQCSDPGETPENDPSAFTNCTDPAQTVPPSTPLPDGGAFYCLSETQYCPYPGEGAQCGEEIDPPSCEVPPCQNDIPVMLTRADAGTDAGARHLHKHPVRRHVDGGSDSGKR